MRVRQLELTATAAAGKQKAKRPRGQLQPVTPMGETEAGVQARIVEALTLHRYLVLRTSRIRHIVRCKCGAAWFPQGGDGADKGVPDLLVTRLGWPAFVWLGLEVKGPNTPLSPEQKDLEAKGRIVVVRSHEEALAAVREYEETIK